uniref:G-protein coupled receptors family 1 profile domain-containing protein n=1 Tax=Gouania willdenowi TaxID=441366 RepID=A0A8C5H5W7_GOUWI
KFCKSCSFFLFFIVDGLFKQPYRIGKNNPEVKSSKYSFKKEVTRSKEGGMATVDDAEFCFSNLNSSCRRIVRPHSVSVLIYITLSSISVMTVYLNLLVIISISHFRYLNILSQCLGGSVFIKSDLTFLYLSLFRKLHTPTNLLLLSLAISDFFVASIGTMVLLSVDRYVAVCEPLQYPTKVTANRVKVCVSLCWIISVLHQSFLLKDNLEQPGQYSTCLGECVVVVSYVGSIVDVILSFIGPVIVIVLMSLRVFVVALSHAHSMRSHVASVRPAHESQFTTKKSELKAFSTISVVIVVFLLCISPYFCVSMTGADSVLNASTLAFVMCLFYLNSFFNPLIYALFYPWFRKSIKLIVTFQIMKPGSSDINLLHRERKR